MYHREIEGLQIGTGVLFADPASEQSFHWIVPLPRASVSGWLQIGEERTTVSGIGYHDHNWGNLDLCEALQRWTWGRVTADAYTMLFWDLLGRGAANSRATSILLWQGPELLLSTDQVKFHSTAPKTEGRTLEHIALQVNGKLPVQAVLRARRVLDVIDFAQPQSRWKSARWAAEKIYFLSERLPLLGRWVKKRIGHGTYRRTQASCELTVATGRLRGQAFYETMDFSAVRLK